MPILDEKSRNKRALASLTRSQKLQGYTKNPFDINKQKDIDVVISYMNDFEWALHGSAVLDFVVNGVFPIVAIKFALSFVADTTIFNYALGMIALCYAYQKYHAATFDEALNELTEIYAWVMRDNNCDEMLEYSVIREMAELLAPFCPEQVIVWERVCQTKGQENKANTWTNLPGMYYVSLAWRMFDSPKSGETSLTKKNEEDHPVPSLKRKIEMRQCTPNNYERLIRAWDYFFKSQKSREKYKENGKKMLFAAKEDAMGWLPVMMELLRAKDTSKASEDEAASSSLTGMK